MVCEKWYELPFEFFTDKAIEDFAVSHNFFGTILVGDNFSKTPHQGTKFLIACEFREAPNPSVDFRLL